MLWTLQTFESPMHGSLLSFFLTIYNCSFCRLASSFVLRSWIICLDVIVVIIVSDLTGFSLYDCVSVTRQCLCLMNFYTHHMHTYFMYPHHSLPKLSSVSVDTFIYYMMVVLLDLHYGCIVRLNRHLQWSYTYWNVSSTCQRG